MVFIGIPRDRDTAVFVACSLNRYIASSPTLVEGTSTTASTTNKYQRVQVRDLSMVFLDPNKET
jgi:hypothetical protein